MEWLAAGLLLAGYALLLVIVLGLAGTDVARLLGLH